MSQELERRTQSLWLTRKRPRRRHLKHPPQIPYFIWECVIDAIRDEMILVDSVSFFRGGGNLHEFEERRTRRQQKALLSTLLKCSLVHSSWLLPARRAAGIFLHKTRSPVTQFIRNPCFGLWTRELHLQFPLTYPESAHLSSLFNRIPNITFLALDFSAARISLLSPETADHIIHTLCEHISRCLRYVEEISLSMYRPDPTSERAHWVSIPGSSRSHSISENASFLRCRDGIDLWTMAGICARFAI